MNGELIKKLTDIEAEYHERVGRALFTRHNKDGSEIALTKEAGWAFQAEYQKFSINALRATDEQIEAAIAGIRTLMERVEPLLVAAPANVQVEISAEDAARAEMARLIAGIDAAHARGASFMEISDLTGAYDAARKIVQPGWGVDLPGCSVQGIEFGMTEAQKEALARSHSPEALAEYFERKKVKTLHREMREYDARMKEYEDVYHAAIAEVGRRRNFEGDWNVEADDAARNAVLAVAARREAAKK